MSKLQARLNPIFMRMTAEKNPIKITKTLTSKRETVFSGTLQFGRSFSDHMFMVNYQNNNWQAPEIIPYQNLELQPSCLVFHYGQAIFEGMKAYKDSNGDVLLFRPMDNIHRFNISAERLCMPTIDPELFLNGLKELIKLDKDWVPSGDGESLYIRPFMIATDEYLGVKPSEKYSFIIITSPVGAYYKNPVKVKVETHYTRAAEGGTGFAKAAGNYAQSLHPARLAAQQGYDQILWTDAKEHKYIEESGTMNVMFVTKDKKVLTPSVGGTILDGVTRKSVLTLAKQMGYSIIEEKISVNQVIELITSEQLLEVFGTGTAATIAPISSIGYQNKDYALPGSDSDSLSVNVLKELDAIRRGLTDDPFGWTIKL